LQKINIPWLFKEKPLEDLTIIIIVTLGFLFLFVFFGILASLCKNKFFKKNFGKLSSLLEKITDAVGDVFLRGFYP